MIDAPASLTFAPVQLVGNPVEINVPPANPVTYPDRTGLRYYLQVFVQEYFQSPTFQQLLDREAAEQPPLPIGGQMVYAGAYFPLETVLDSYLSTTAPSFGQEDFAICENLTRQYYVIAVVKNNGTTISTTAYPTSVVLKGGVSEVHAADWSGRLLSNTLGKAGQFLTWHPAAKTIYPDSPEYLYYLVNCTPRPTAIKLRAKVDFEDGSSLVLTIRTLTSVLSNTVYCVPVGPAALNLEEFSTVVKGYSVWLSNQSDARISDVRSYVFDTKYRRHVRHLLFDGGFGNFDTLTCVGKASENISVERDITERYPQPDHLPTYAERVVNERTGERELTISIGYVTKQVQLYLQALMFSREIYLVTDRAHIPLLLDNTDFVPTDDDENVVGRTFTFRYANPETAYSSLPAVPAAASRPTAWRSFATACELDSFGKRTGNQRTTLLEKYYTDDNTAVKPAVLKPNVPGTEGYIAPSANVACSVGSTPFTSAAYSAQSTFTRDNCAANELGTAPTITIASGRWGSEISQADADAKAVAEWESLNTQAYANANGTCAIATGPGYAYSVPANHFHYRAETPWQADMAIEYRDASGNRTMGTRGGYTGTNAYQFNVGTIDADFPSTNVGGNWRVGVKVDNGEYPSVKIYRNGVLVQTFSWTEPVATTVWKYVNLSFTPANGDKLYFKYS